jgi:hypothetical protein
MPNSILHYEYQAHQMLSLTISQLSHFCLMTIPDDPAKTRQISVIDQNYPAVIATPYQLALTRLKISAKYAIFH